MTDDIDRFLDGWATAERSGDAHRLSGLLTDDFLAIGPLGFSLSKDEWIARYRRGLSYRTFDVEDTAVRDHDGVAVVTARYVQRGTAFGHPIPEAVRSTMILVRQGDGWRLDYVHMSFVAGTPGAPPLPGAPAGG